MFKFSSNTLWLLLLIATGFTYWLGESGKLGHASRVPVLLIFGVSFFKGVAVIFDFMALRHAPALWRPPSAQPSLPSGRALTSQGVYCHR